LVCFRSVVCAWIGVLCSGWRLRDMWREVGVLATSLWRLPSILALRSECGCEFLFVLFSRVRGWSCVWGRWKAIDVL
jgi:hypothetical protein